MAERETGTVKWFKAEKGYGFITPEGCEPNTGKDIFVHHTEMPEGLKEGAEVTYEMGESDHNKQDVVAVNVELVEADSEETE